MKVAIYGKSLKKDTGELVSRIQTHLLQRNIKMVTYKPYAELLEQVYRTKPVGTVFTSHADLPADTHFMISLGGDGTFLDTINYIKEYNIPVVGINTGRLGFLANIAQSEIEHALDEIIDGHCMQEERTLLELTSTNDLFGRYNYALNEFTIHKRDTSSMITVHTYVDGEFLNSYWADGLIIATPTGSTAYSLSVGGPLLVPNSKSLVITPIAPHNLTVRPLVVADDCTLSFKVEGRAINFLASLDHRSEVFDSNTKLELKKADFCLKILKPENNSFYNTLRNKLMWGADKRN